MHLCPLPTAHCPLPTASTASAPNLVSHNPKSHFQLLNQRHHPLALLLLPFLASKPPPLFPPNILPVDPIHFQPLVSWPPKKDRFNSSLFCLFLNSFLPFVLSLSTSFGTDRFTTARPLSLLFPHRHLCQFFDQNAFFPQALGPCDRQRWRLRRHQQ